MWISVMADRERRSVTVLLDPTPIWNPVAEMPVQSDLLAQLEQWISDLPQVSAIQMGKEVLHFYFSTILSSFHVEIRRSELASARRDLAKMGKTVFYHVSDEVAIFEMLFLDLEELASGDDAGSTATLAGGAFRLSGDKGSDSSDSDLHTSRDHDDILGSFVPLNSIDWDWKRAQPPA
jgi:hypothetical protein